MNKIEMTKVKGKYAEQRVKFLDEYATDMLDAMVADNSIYEHLNFVQELVSEYVNNYVDKVKQSDEYKKAESECDLVKMNSIITTAQTTAEFDAAEEWIFSVPETNGEADEAEEDPEKAFEDMSYDEAVEDIYNGINKIKTAISDSETEESEEE